MDLIDRIRRDIQDRLDALLAEADRLRRALAALDPRAGAPKPPTAPRADSQPPSATRPRARRRPSTAGRPSPTPPATATATRRTPPGATKRRVLEALSDGQARTAGEVAAATGIARGTVSTTLSKLARSGEVTRAQRGYRLPTAEAEQTSRRGDGAARPGAPAAGAPESGVQSADAPDRADAPKTPPATG